MDEKPRRVRKNLVILHTGNGKGKTTAALGTAFRAMGHGWRVCMVQFIKGKWKPGEVRMASKLPPGQFEIIPMGEGFTWESENLAKDRATAQRAWEIAKEKLLSGEYQLVILDEITYTITYKFLDLDDVIDTIRGRPSNVNVIMTGRGAHPALVELADLVSEVHEVKHPYRQGILAQVGIEY
ncbi:MAG TPA: cob(I)yrinic acid a,c-diamide adenosyltransferase [Candidatus Tectomicrobia bacterium]|nr:cob(I)yrinic acid a,c-diamide adenosyltransferase [Candidatus Tectomicrobia bacterium]